jgi:predicted exporter
MKLITVCYESLEKRRGWLVLALLVLVLLTGWRLSGLHAEENITALLPDGDSPVSRDFQLLQQAPFSRKLLINLTASAGIETRELLDASDRLRDALPAELFLNPVNGPGLQQGARLLEHLGPYLPRLADAGDLQSVAARLNPGEVDRHLQIALTQLLQPQGVALKNKIRRDPLDLESLALRKLRYLNPVPDVQLVQGHFLSRDGRHSLIIADTPIALTDSQGSKRLLESFAGAQRQLPPGVSAELVSGHSYTLANATIIQQDISRVLFSSAIGILLLFCGFLRSCRALFVYLLPLLSFAVALLAVTLCYQQVSGITVGFGAVLLGITIDFGLHVYFALRYSHASRSAALRAVSRPVFFGGLTTLAAFAVLLGSELPGQRQLAVFAMAGVIAALLLALLVLPHFIGDAQTSYGSVQRRDRRLIYAGKPMLRWSIIVLWLGVTLASAFQARHLTVNGDLRQLSYMSTDLRQAEQRLTEAWGNLRGRAIVFAMAADLETALQSNERVWQILDEHQLQSESVSLAPLLASQLTQRQRLESWASFWQEHRAATQELVARQAGKYGFASNAFAPFFVNLEQAPEPLDVDSLRQWGLDELLENLLLKTGQGYRLLTLIPDRPDLISKLDSELSQVPGVALVSQLRFGRQLSEEISADFNRFILSAAFAVVALLVLLFRRVPEILLSLLPVLTGLLVMFGGMGWLGLEMNLFNVVASILIIGLGVDYGIFMVCHAQSLETPDSSRAVLVSGLTTLVGFGALLLARHPALHSIGLTVLLGIGAAVPTAVLVVPAFPLKSR